MKIAFPTTDNQGLNSPVYGHFGSAPFFIITDSDNETFEAVGNPDKDHEHGNCQPLAALGGVKVDAVIVGGIGGGALRKLNQAGINTFRAVEGSVDDNLKLMKTGLLPLFNVNQTCAGHGADGECSH